MFIVFAIVLTIGGPLLNTWADRPLPWWSFYVAAILCLVAEAIDPFGNRTRPDAGSRSRHPSSQPLTRDNHERID